MGWKVMPFFLFLFGKSCEPNFAWAFILEKDVSGIGFAFTFVNQNYDSESTFLFLVVAFL